MHTSIVGDTVVNQYGEYKVGTGIVKKFYEDRTKKIKVLGKRTCQDEDCNNDLSNKRLDAKFCCSNHQVRTFKRNKKRAGRR